MHQVDDEVHLGVHSVEKHLLQQRPERPGQHCDGDMVDHADGPTLACVEEVSDGASHGIARMLDVGVQNPQVRVLGIVETRQQVVHFWVGICLYEAWCVSLGI